MDNILAVEKILGGLRQVNFNQNQIKCDEFIDTSRFSAKKYTISFWSDYGQYNEDRLILTHEGKTDDIELNGYTISSIVKDIHLFYLSREQVKHDFTLSIQSPEEEVYEQTFRIYNNELLRHIVYAIIFITNIKDKNKTNMFWNMLVENDFPNISLGQKLDYVIQLNTVANSIIKQYPFTKSFFQNGLKKIISNFKSELSSLEILK